MAKLKQKEKQKRCHHRFITIPAGYDYELDEVYEITVCKKCGYQLI